MTTITVKVRKSFLYYGLEQPERMDKFYEGNQFLLDIEHLMTSPRGAAVELTINKEQAKVLAQVLDWAKDEYYVMGRKSRAGRIMKLIAELDKFILIGQYNDKAEMLSRTEQFTERQIAEMRMAESCVMSVANECEKWAKDLGLVQADLNTKVKFSYAQSRRRSYGGLYDFKAGISLALRRRIPALNPHGTVGQALISGNPQQLYTFYEYKSFARDEEIGTYSSSDWLDMVRVLTIHEMSHVIQYQILHGESLMREYARDTLSVSLEDMKADKGHGELFRRVYRLLRQRFGFTCTMNMQPKAASEN